VSTQEQQTKSLKQLNLAIIHRISCYSLLLCSHLLSHSATQTRQVPGKHKKTSFGASTRTIFVGLEQITNFM